ncbi:MAG: UDP-N-acetylmuramate dehydrogenase [Candidatus Bipolaricaulota bacterium]|nr:MAG: UDP-N-acetylmuramate dehydrogenase [Candidatus Bipolaricaulota bacterium]
MDAAELHARLAAIAGGIEDDVPLAALTTLGVGGPAKRLVAPRTQAELGAVVELLEAHSERFLVLGGGSNLLFSDRGFSGTVIATTALRAWSVETAEVTAECGVPLQHLLSDAAVAATGALDFLVGIPGTIGGATVMNAGIRGASMSDVVASVTVLVHGGGREILDGDSCGFRYRGSALADAGRTVLETTLRLTGRRFDRDSLSAVRRATQPVGKRTAGCVFRNPPGMAAGELIEVAGLKGARVGDAIVSEIHGNFIENQGHATSDEIRSLIDIVRRKVYKGFRVLLELEIEVVAG